MEFKLLGPSSKQNCNFSRIFKWQTSVIVYLGETDDVSRYIQSATCVVLPSYRESASRVLLETRQLVGLLLPLMFRVAEVVDHEGNGFLCLPKDVDDLAAKMLRMIALSDLKRREMGLASREKVEKGFSQRVVVELYLRELQKVLANNARGSERF